MGFPVGQIQIPSQTKLATPRKAIDENPTLSKVTKKRGKQQKIPLKSSNFVSDIANTLAAKKLLMN